MAANKLVFVLIICLLIIICANVIPIFACTEAKGSKVPLVKIKFLTPFYFNY